jgi:hypothetical protein
MTKVYLKAAFFVAVTIATFGLVLPFLFSARDDFLVIAGVVVLAAYPIFAWHYGFGVLNQIKQKVSN